MNQKGLIYFLVMVLLFSAGVVFSNSAHNIGSAYKAGSVLHEAAGMILLDFPIDEQTNFPNKVKNIIGYQFTSIEKTSTYSLENYILPKRHSADREDTRRTNLWFTSRLRN